MIECTFVCEIFGCPHPHVKRRTMMDNTKENYTLDLYSEIAELQATKASLLEEVDALANIVALNSHGDNCYAENWWDSSCDCGLMDLVLRLTPSLQNKLEAIREAKESR